MFSCERDHLEQLTLCCCLSGLINLGNTCYFGSVLQLLYYSHFPKLIRSASESSSLLIKKLNRLFKDMKSATPNLSPRQVFNAYPEWKPHARTQQHCAGEFLSQLLDRLNDIIEFDVKNNSSGAQANLLAFDAVCGHTLVKERRCSNSVCQGKTRVQEDRQYMLKLDLCDSVQDALDKYFDNELIPEVVCWNCNGKTTQSLQSKFKTAPELLFCQLQRFKTIFTVDKKTGLKIPVETRKQHKPCHIDSKVMVGDCEYSLRGVIVHDSEEADHGHYYTLIRGQDGSWLKFDDTRVDIVSAEIVQGVEGKLNVNKHAKRPTAYILAYARAKPLCVTQFFDPGLELGNNNSGNNNDIDYIEIDGDGDAYDGDGDNGDDGDDGDTEFPNPFMDPLSVNSYTGRAVSPTLTSTDPQLSRTSCSIWTEHGIFTGSSDHKIRLWDPQARLCFRELEIHTRPVTAMSCLESPHMASTARDMTIKVWNQKTGAITKTLSLDRTATALVHSANRLYVGMGQIISVWNCETWDCLGEIKLSAYVRCLAVVGEVLASGSFGTSIILWDVASLQQAGVLNGHTGGVTCLQPLPNGRLASGSRDNTIRIWDLKSTTSQILTGHSDGVTCLASDGERLFSGSLDCTVRVWSAGSHNVSLNHGKVITCLAACADLLLSASVDAFMWWVVPSSTAVELVERRPISLDEKCSWPQSVIKFFLSLKAWQLSFQIPISTFSILLQLWSVFTANITVSDSNLPVTMYNFDKSIGTHTDNDSDLFDLFAFCKFCSSIKSLDQCISAGGFLNPCLCPKSRAAKAVLGHKTKDKTFIPKTPYVYSPLRTRLAELFMQPEFETQIEHWRDRAHILSDHKEERTVYRDIYDGAIWKRFETEDGIDFLRQPFSLAFGLNVDWFQPYVRGVYSAGAVYLTLLNLPRKLRYRKENMILVCLLPGGKEKDQDLNKLLAPLVDELLCLWDGCLFRTPTCETGRLIRAALICISCDLPAARKVTGMKSCTTCCSKCHQEFKHYPTDEKKKDGHAKWRYDCSGNDYESWVPRTAAEVKLLGEQYLECKNNNQRDIFVKNFDVRYSVFSKLPYFDPVTMTVVDPLHNLYLGVTKYIIDVWKKSDILTTAHMKTLEKKINSLSVSKRYGRMRSIILLTTTTWMILRLAVTMQLGVVMTEFSITLKSFLIISVSTLQI